MDTIDIVGDEIWFGPWKLGARHPGMTATAWYFAVGVLCAAEDIQALEEAHEADLKSACDEVRAEVENDYERKDGGKLDAAFEAGWRSADDAPAVIDQVSRLRERLRRRKEKEKDAKK